MNSYYPTSFEASSPDSISPPSSIAATSPHFIFTQTVPSPEFSGEFDMLQGQPQDVDDKPGAEGSLISPDFKPLDAATSYRISEGSYDNRHPGRDSDIKFASSLRSIRGSRSSPDQGFKVERQEGPSECEATVAETIVRSRKSWKTVKGRSEPVWPPHLERALVQALLQYKPHDSRYARALGRFPKRNRYISDFIFDTTGVRRTPKQVGSRLQQLKDVTCGKMLLNHVANWALEDTPPVATTLNRGDLFPSGNLHLADSNVYDDTAEGLESPVSPLSSGGLSGEGTSCSTGPVPKPYNSHPTLLPSAGRYRRSSATISPSISPPLTPVVRKINVFLPFDHLEIMDGGGKASRGRARPLVTFGGCLARPETVTAPVPSDAGKASAWMEPRAVFNARDPIAAQSISRVWVDNIPLSSSALSMTSSYTAVHGRVQGTKVQIHEHNEPVVCTQTPAARASAAQTSFYPLETIASMQGNGDDRESFIYATRLVDDSTWRSMRQAGVGLRRYTITQQLMHSLDSPGTTRGETFLIITYHFVPIPSSSHSASALNITGLLPLDTRCQDYGTISPLSSGTPSPVSACSSTFSYPVSFRAQMRHGGGLQADSPHSYNAHSFVHPHPQLRLPQVSVQPPDSTVSQPADPVSPFSQDGCFNNSTMAGSLSSDYNVDFNGLDMDTLHLSQSPTGDVSFDQLQQF